MANGIYTALDYDIDYLAHSGRKGMKWYQHLYGLQQSLNKYAKGAATKGVSPVSKEAMRANLASAKTNKSLAVSALKRKDFKKAAGYAKESIKRYGEAARIGVKAYGKAALAKATGKIAKIGAKAAGKMYRGAARLDQFMHSPTYRKARISSWKKKASDFGKAVRKAIGSTIDKAKIKYEAFKTTQRTKKGVEAGRQRYAERQAADAYKREQEKKRAQNKKNKRYGPAN